MNNIEDDTYLPHVVYCKEHKCCYNFKGICTVAELREEGELIPCHGGHN